MRRGVLAPRVGAGALILAALTGGWLWMGGKQKPTQPLKTLGLGRQPTGIALDARAGRAAVINTGDGSVSFVDTRDGSVVMTVHLRHGLPLAVAMDGRTGHTFVAGAGPGGASLNPNASPVSILDTRRGRVLRSVSIPGVVRGIAADEGAGRVFVLTDVAFAKPARGGVTILDAARGAVLRTVAVGANPVGIGAPGVSSSSTRVGPSSRASARRACWTREAGPFCAR